MISYSFTSSSLTILFKFGWTEDEIGKAVLKKRQISQVVDENHKTIQVIALHFID